MLFHDAEFSADEYKLTRSWGHSTFDDATFCLSGSEEWNDNVDEIKSAKFITAGFWIESGTTAGLTGDLNVTLQQDGSSGTTLFNLTLPNIIASDYVNNGLVLTLTEAQIQLINLYLSSYSNKK